MLWVIMANVFRVAVYSIVHHSSSGALKAWRRPLLIKQPLGIVSGTELAFCLTFLAFIVWFFSCYLSNALANFKGEGGEKESNGL